MALRGLTVIDVGTAVAGPYCTTLLSDLGADVIKVEKPGRGDLIRFTDRYVDGESGYFIGVNRGKRSITADVRTAEGQEIIRRLVRQADVIVENFRPGAMEKWGLGYRTLRAENTRLVYCSMKAFPQARGFETVAGNDITVQAYSGLMDLTGYEDGPPAKVGAPLVDTGASLLGTIGVLAALRQRETSGEGDHVSVSLLETAYALMPNFLVTELNSDHRFCRLGSGHPQLVPYQAFMCADGNYIVVGAFHRESWNRLCSALDREDIRVDTRFAENFDRVQNRTALIPLLQVELLKKSRDDWIGVFDAIDVPCSPILSLNDSLAFFAERLPGLIEETSHATLGTVRMLRFPVRLANSQPAPRREAAPTLGADTDAVLSQIGYSAADLSALRERRII